MVFRVAFVTGVVPDKWARVWRDRMPTEELDLHPVDEAGQLDGVRDGSAAMAFVRLPVDRDGLHLIPLYTEVAVVVADKEHPIAAFDELSTSDLAGELILRDPMTPADAIATAATGAGLVIVPMSVARLHHRKDAVFRPLVDVPETQIGLAWLADNDDPLVQTFIAIVRGRTTRSSRT